MIDGLRYVYRNGERVLQYTMPHVAWCDVETEPCKHHGTIEKATKRCVDCGLKLSRAQQLARARAYKARKDTNSGTETEHE